MFREAMDFIRTRKKCNLLLVLINVLVFVVFLWMNPELDAVFMYEHGAIYPPAVVTDGEWWRLFTGMFLHFSAQHLLYNMLLLLFAGDMLQGKLGAVKYLILYLVGGLAGNLFSMILALGRNGDIGLLYAADQFVKTMDPSGYAISAGASGAIFAVIGALVWIVIRNRGNASGLNNRGILAMAVLSLAEGYMTAGVDAQAHLGGAIGGFLLCIFLYRRKGNGDRRVQGGSNTFA